MKCHGDQRTKRIQRAGNEKPLSLIEEFLVFIRENKKWWLIPILLIFGLIGILVTLSATGVAPFIYPAF